MRDEWKKLPDVFLCLDGVMVKTKKDWEEMRRPELLKLFEQEEYGRIPEQELKVTIRLTNECANENIISGTVVRKTVEVEVERKGKVFSFNFVVFVPKTGQKAPVVITICNRGIRDSDPSREFLGDFWPAETIIARGYAAAVFRTQEVVPDYAEGYTVGFHRLFPEFFNDENNRPLDFYGAISAWSWAVSRIIDYVEMDRDLDEKRVIVVGHSRGGKTALWTAARDQRVAMVVSSCAGNSGDALSRGNTGERIADITEKYPYWFCRKYQNYRNREDELPFDQHMLLSLIVPRHIYTSAKTRDAWADPEGAFQSLLQTEKVYQLYEKQALETNAKQIAEYPLMSGEVGHHLKTGVHDLDAYDWKCYLDFADQHLK